MELDLKNVDHIKRKWFPVISSEKVILCSQLPSSSSGKLLEQIQRNDYMQSKAGHSPMLQLFFSQFSLQVFDCSVLGVFYSALTNSCRFPCSKNPQIFLPYFTGISPAPNSPFGPSKSFLRCPSGLCVLLPPFD